MLFTYISRCHLWLYMHSLANDQMIFICAGIKEKSKNKEWYNYQKLWYEDAANSIWQTYLRFGEVLKIVHNQWMIPPTL